MGAYIVLDPRPTQGDNVKVINYEDSNFTGEFKKLEYNIPKKDYDPEKDTWYGNCIKVKDGKWSEPHKDKNGRVQISYTRPIIKDGVVIGLVGIDSVFDYYKNQINNLKLYNSGYAFLLGNKFNYIVHKSLTEKDNLQSQDGGKYKSLTDEMSKNKSGVIDCTFNGNKMMLGYSHTSNGWILVTAVPRNEIFADEIRKLAEKIAISTKQIGNIINEIQQEINLVKTNMDKGQVITKEANEAMSDATKAFISIRTSLENTTNQLVGLSSNIQKVNIDKEDVIEVIQSLSSISEESAASTEEASSSIEEQVSSINNILETVENLNQMSNKLNTAIEKFTI